MRLLLKYTTIDHLTFHPGDEAPTQVLVVRSRLTPPLAEDLDCRVQCYTELGIPLRNFESLPLLLTMQGAEVTMGANTWMCALATKFKIVRPKSSTKSDISLDVTMRLHFDGSVQLVDFIRNTNKAEFEMVVHPPDGWSVQQSLPLTAGKEESGDEDEDEDEPEEAPPIRGDCVDCANEIPLEADGITHVSGQSCTAVQPAQEPLVTSAAALPSAAEMGVGTHQRKRRTLTLKDPSTTVQ